MRRKHPTYEEMLERVLSGELSESAVVHHYYHLDDYEAQSPAPGKPQVPAGRNQVGRGTKNQKGQR